MCRVQGIETSREPLTIEYLDFDPHCQYRNRFHLGDCGQVNPATWAVWYVEVNSCGCPSPRFRLFCSECFQKRTAATHIGCGKCGAPIADNIVRAERL